MLELNSSNIDLVYAGAVCSCFSDPWIVGTPDLHDAPVGPLRAQATLWGEIYNPGDIVVSARLHDVSRAECITCCCDGNVRSTYWYWGDEEFGKY